MPRQYLRVLMMNPFCPKFVFVDGALNHDTFHFLAPIARADDLSFELGRGAQPAGENWRVRDDTR